MYNGWPKPRKEEPKSPVIERDPGIPHQLMTERMEIAGREPDLYRRLRILEKLKTQVHPQSKAFIDFHIRKTQSKIGEQND